MKDYGSAKVTGLKIEIVLVLDLVVQSKAPYYQNREDIDNSEVIIIKFWRTLLQK